MKRRRKPDDARHEGWVAVTVAAAALAAVVLSQENPVVADEVMASIAALGTDADFVAFDRTPLRATQPAASGPVGTR
jgi:hypothetical protein